MGLFDDSQLIEEGVSVILDIRSGSVGVALVNNKGGQLEVLWTKRQSIDFLTEHDTDRLLHMTRRALAKSLEDVQDTGLVHVPENESISNVMCFFAAPWHVGSPQEITIKKDSKFTVNNSRIRLAQDKAQDMFLEDTVTRYGAKKNNLQPLSSTVLSVWCNGYQLEHPKDVQVDNLRVLTYVSMLPERIKNITEHQISQHLHPDKISLHSFTTALHSTFTETFTHPKSFLVINVDEEMTQLLVVNSGVLMGSVSYPLGSHFLIRTLAKALDIPAADARAKIRQYQKGESEDDASKKITDVLEKSRDRWQELLVSSLGEFSEEVSIPEYAFVLAGSNTSATFADFAKTVDVEKHIITQPNLRIHEVTNELLDKHLDVTADTRDHYLSIASLNKHQTHAPQR